jgi:hypothetical protein
MSADKLAPGPQPLQTCGGRPVAKRQVWPRLAPQGVDARMRKD